METHTLGKTQMQTLESLAQANMRVSDARNALSKIQEQETDYLIVREKKATAIIKKVVEDSASILKGASENYKEVASILTTVTTLCEFVVESQAKIEKLFESFETQSEVWEQKCKKQQEDFDNVKKQLLTDRVAIENDKKFIEKTKKLLMNQQKKIDDRNAMIERTITRLKANRI